MGTNSEVPMRSSRQIAEISALRPWLPGASLRFFSLTVLFLTGTARALLAQGPQDYIVSFKAGTSAATREAVVKNAGATLGFNFNRVRATAVKVANANALAALQNDPSVLAVVPDRPVHAYQTAKGRPSGGGTAKQVVPAGVVRVGAPTTTSNGSGVGVAVVDTGVDLAHADLANVFNAFNAFGGSSCQDDEGHGTHVAGIIAAQNNGIDVVGVAPNARIFCVKVLDNTGNGSDATVMAGLQWVLDNHLLVAPNIKVVNMSLGREGSVDDNPAMQQLVAALKAADVTVVVAAGNDPSLDVSQQIPAAYPEVVAVASTTASAGSNSCRFLSSPIAADTASYFTSDGQGVLVSAPGEEREDVNRGCFISSVGILSTHLGGGTTRMSGTSMAAPHVSGLVARYYQANYAYKADDIRQFLASDAVRVGTAPLNSPASSYTYDGVREGIAHTP